MCWCACVRQLVPIVHVLSVLECVSCLCVNWDIIAHLVMRWHVFIVSVCSMVSMHC